MRFPSSFFCFSSFFTRFPFRTSQKSEDHAHTGLFCQNPSEGGDIELLAVRPNAELWVITHLPKPTGSADSCVA